ncbi:MAG: hypothetical protein WC897_03330 [Candidatus Gracilibacteria bacterium]
MSTVEDFTASADELADSLDIDGVRELFRTAIQLVYERKVTTSFAPFIIVEEGNLRARLDVILKTIVDFRLGALDADEAKIILGL